MELDWWLELESEYATKIAQRQELYAKHGQLVLDHQPGSELACKELMEMALQFLAARYPMYFSLKQSSSTGSWVFHNEILNVTTDLASVHPLLVLLAHVPEDFAIVLRNPTDGLYYFRAGVICSSLGWHVGSKI